MTNIFVVYSFVLNLDQQYLILLLKIQLPEYQKIISFNEKEILLLHFVHDEHALKIFQVNDYEHNHYSIKQKEMNLGDKMND